MTSSEEFLEIFKDTGFSREALIRFYRSIKKLVILSYVGRSALPVLLKLDKEAQWPVLKDLDDPTLGIYKGADPELLAAFIKTIKRQKEERSWLTFWSLAQERAELYEKIFDFSPQEIAMCRRVGRRFEKILIKRRRKQRLIIGVGSGIVAAGAVGTGAFIWWKSKEKK